MQRLTLALLMLCLLGGAVSAQIFMEPFNYTPGTTIGVWAEHLGDWNAVNSTAFGPVAESEQKRAYQYLVYPAATHTLQDCAADCMVYYNTGSSQALQFGGPALRVNNPAANTDLFHVKVQDNNSNGAFDSIWLYERPGGSASKTGITPEFTTAMVRLLCIGNRLEAQVDTTGDGLWDYVVTKTGTMTVKPGPVGLCAYGGAWMDDYNLFDAVMLDDTPVVKPQLNTTIKFVMRGLPNAKFQAASSLGNAGIPLPDGRVIPLTADSLFYLSISGVLPSIFMGYNGTMDGSGDSFVEVALPNIPSLVGVTFYTSFANYSTSILNISNDHQVTIVP